jgi:signal transduction histidine kinase/tetratricopeptide (TPR) repeat protein
MKRGVLLIFTALFVAISMFAGSKEKTDSLKKVLATQKDTVRVLTLVKLSQALLPVNRDSALHYALMLKKEAEAWGKPERICDAYVVVGTCYNGVGEKDSAMIFKRRALDVAAKVNYQKGIANACNDIGLYYQSAGLPDSAAIYILRSIGIREKANEEKALASSYTNLALIYRSQSYFDKALFYFKKAAALFRKYNQASNYALLLNNIAVTYDDQQKYDSALVFYKQSLAIRDSLEDERGISQCKLNIGVTYRNLLDFTRAEKFILEALALKIKLGEPQGEAYCRLDLALTYRLQRKLRQAEVEIVKADSLTVHSGEKEFRRDLYLEYAELYAALGKFDLALKSQKEYERLRDEIFNADKAKTLAEIQTKYETTKKEKENFELREAAAARELVLERERSQRLYLYAGIGILALILAFGIYAYMSRIKTNRLLNEKNGQITRQNGTLKELNKKLIVSEEELTVLNHTKDKLFSIISHDLSNPVKAIANYNQAMLARKESMTKEELVLSFEKLDQNIQPLQGFLDNLLHWSALQQSGLKIRKETFDVSSLIDETIALYAAHVQLKKIRIVTAITGAHEVHTDKNMFRLILRNLLNNAIKFSPERAEVEIKVRNEVEKTILVVTDRGSGISPAILESLRNGQPVESQKGTLAEGGTGLGVSLVREYLVKLGGEMQIESETGRTVFTVFL